jgi:hypothetical protein
LSLAISLALLYGITKLVGQPLTVATLGVLISLTASMGVTDVRPRRQLVNAGLMLVVACTAVGAGVWLSSDKLAGEAVFVVIIAAATFAQR